MNEDEVNRGGILRYQRFEKINATNNISPRNLKNGKDGMIVYAFHN